MAVIALQNSSIRKTCRPVARRLRTGVIPCFLRRELLARRSRAGSSASFFFSLEIFGSSFLARAWSFAVFSARGSSRTLSSRTLRMIAIAR